MMEEQRRPVLKTWRAALALAGLAITTYLSVSYVTGQAPACGSVVAGCAQVTTSAYARVLGAPVAVLGLSIFALLLLGSLGALAYPARSAPVSVALTVVSGGGVLFSLYLTAVELFILHAICVWCVTSALLVAGIFALSLAEAVPSSKAGAVRPDVSGGA